MAFEIGNSTQEVITGQVNRENVESMLIVDDDSSLRKLHTSLASHLGFRTFTAENGKQAVELFQSGAHFNFVIMDFEMPIMNGVEATTILREMGLDCKILAVTACEDATIKERFIEAGVDLFLTKPLNLKKLASALQNI